MAEVGPVKIPFELSVHMIPEGQTAAVVHPGDTLIIAFRSRMDEHERDAMEKSLQKQFRDTGIKWVAIPDVAALMVYSPDNTTIDPFTDALQQFTNRAMEATEPRWQGETQNTVWICPRTEAKAIHPPHDEHGQHCPGYAWPAPGKGGSL